MTTATRKAADPIPAVLRNRLAAADLAPIRAFLADPTNATWDAAAFVSLDPSAPYWSIITLWRLVQRIDATFPDPGGRYMHAVAVWPRIPDRRTILAALKLA